MRVFMAGRALLLAVVLSCSALGAQAAARIPPPNPKPEIRYQLCPGAEWALGCTRPARPFIVYIAPAMRRSKLTRWHELGHVFDYQHMTPYDRARWTLELDYLAHGWREPFDRETCERAQAHSKDDAACDTLHERFADSYMLCIARPRLRRQQQSGEVFGSTDYRPTPRQHRRVCRLIRSIRLP